MDVSELVVGEIYNLNGRRARVDSIGSTEGGENYLRPYDPDNPYAMVTVSVGRSFERQITLLGSRWRRSVINEIDETWEGMKERKKAEKAHRQESDEVSKELRAVLQKMGMNGGWIEGGHTTIYADLSQLRSLTAILAAHVEDGGNDSAALAELLG